MAWTVHPDIEAALWRAVERTLPAHVRTGRVLRSAVVQRSLLYTSEREQMHEPALSRSAGDADLAARALFFTVADAAKVTIPLAELEAVELLAPGTGEISILDIGAGAGAMTLGTLDYLHLIGALEHRAVRIHAVDRDRRALDIMALAVAELGERFGARISLTIEGADLEHARMPSGSADLVLAGTVLNELTAEAREPMTRRMIAACKADGSVIIIEPALRDTARALHSLRDRVIEGRLAHVFAPCTRTLSPCPALAGADGDDWCYEDRPTVLTPRAAQMATLTGLRTHGLKFAYLTLRHDAASQTSGQDSGDTADADSNDADANNNDGERQALRIVSHIMRSKGKRECFACGDSGRVLVRLLRRKRSIDNRPFERVRRGDVLLVPARLAAGGDVECDDVIDMVCATPGIPEIPTKGHG